MEIEQLRPQQIIEDLTDYQFATHLSTMPVGKDITFPVAQYIQYVFINMYPTEREQMGPKMFARNILVFRAVAELGEERFDAIHTALENNEVDLTSATFDVQTFYRLIGEDMSD